MRNNGTRAFLLSILLAAPILGACAGPDVNMNGMPGMNGKPTTMPATMGEPSAPPAFSLPGARLRTARLTLLNTRPPGLDGAVGTAWLATHPGGTTVTVDMMGLKPGDRYTAHLHAQPCAQNNGGGHFKFDPHGPAAPPNEVHLAFTADQTGHGIMTVNNPQAADGAKSLVVHPAITPDNRIACADF